MNLLFLLFLVLILGCGHRGYTRGLFGIIYGTLTWILILAFVSVSAPVIHSFLMNQPAFYDVCYKQLYPVCEKIVSSGAYKANSNNLSDSGMMQDFMQSVVGTKEDEKKYDIIFEEGATDEEINEVINGTKPGNKKEKNPEATHLCEKTTDSILGVAALGVSYIISKMFMLFFKMVIYGLVERKEKDLPVGVNYTGMILGGFEGVLYTWVIMALASELWFSAIAANINRWIADNSFLEELAANNFLYDILFL